MEFVKSIRPSFVVCLFGGLIGLINAPLAAQPQTIMLKNGQEFEGRFATIPEYSETLPKIPPSGLELHSIALIDDGLRRVFTNYKQIAQAPVPVERPFQRIPVWQELTVGQEKTWRFGNLTRAEPFNDLGHRVIGSSGLTRGGNFVQGVTEITPTYCRVTALRDQDWDMKVATSTIPSDVLIKLLRRQIQDPNSITKRLEIVDLLIQSKRYQDANGELKSIQETFPDLTAEISEKRQILSQQFARQVLQEIRTRMDNGQTELAMAMTEKIKGPDVSAEILAEILTMVQSIQQKSADVELAKTLLQQTLDQLVQEANLSAESTATVNVTADEIINQLNSANLERLATFVRLAPDAELNAAQKVAYALSGWIIGSGAAIDDIEMTVALVDARRLTVEYLNSDDPQRREEILLQLESIEAGDPQSIARIVQHIKPPWAPSAEINLLEPLELSVEIPGPAADPSPRTVRYLVQLPAQYDPYRRYPCIVALHAESQSLEEQLQWWAGSYNPQLKMAMGQAARYGYIVIAPEWNVGTTRDYEYSASEQMAVLKSFRDALRRFAIDTDRVYLAGHFAGGDAAWDIGMSYPDIWAGVVPISAFAGEGGKYAFRCYETAAFYNVPFYFVCGQQDVGRIVHNKSVWNKWMQAPSFDVIVVEYQGRLAESFAEEQPGIFQWMSRHRRNAAVEQFTGRTLRPWNTQFWWIEVGAVPLENVVLPTDWPPKEKKLAAHFDCKVIRGQNKFTVNVGKDNFTTLWLTPDLVDFSKNIEIGGRGSDFRGMAIPNRAVILEDVRQRGDRQHPYWAKMICERSTWRPF